MELQRIIELAEPELGDALSDYITQHIPAFLSLAERHPLPRRSEYVSLGEAFWLYRLTLELQPKLVVESGTMDGYSAWWLRQGAGEDTDLITFDPINVTQIDLSLGYGRHRHHKADFKQWLRVPPYTLDALAFFDDHQDQGARLDQAAAAGFRHVLFHDCYPGSGAHPSLWERGVGRFPHTLVFQFPTLRLGTPYCDRWLVYVRLL